MSLTETFQAFAGTLAGLSPDPVSPSVRGEAVEGPLVSGATASISRAAGSVKSPTLQEVTGKPDEATIPVAYSSAGVDGIDQFMHAIRAQESSHNYNVLGPQTRYGRPRGAYQILDTNWDAWAAEAGIPGADWRSPEAQDRVARFKMLQYFQQFGGRWDAVAVAWFAGPGRADDWVNNPASLAATSDILGTSVAQYVRRMQAGMAAGGAVTASAASTTVSGVPVRPRPEMTAQAVRGALSKPVSLLPPGVDDGRGMDDLPGRRTGSAARATVDVILARVRADSVYQTNPGVRRAQPNTFAPTTAAAVTPQQTMELVTVGPDGGVGEQAVRAAQQFLGTPYVWGGAQPGGFDCSGLLQYVYGQLGVQIPRVSRDQARAGVAVASLDQARPGDLVAFDAGGERGVVNHIGMYLGNGMMIHAPRRGRSVEVVPVGSRVGDIMAIRRVAGAASGSGTVAVQAVAPVARVSSGQQVAAALRAALSGV